MGTNSHGIQELTNFAKDMLQRSGTEALSYYGRGTHKMKFDEGLVTAAELHLREFFQTTLAAHFPEHQLYSNAPPTNGYTHEGKRYLWIYDAIEGAANFQAGIPIWGTSVALLENFWPIFGMFYMPVTGDLFQAEAGQPPLWGKEPMSVSIQENIDDESLLLSYSRFHQHFQCTFPGKVRDFGCTAAHICYVALGRAEAAVLSNESYQSLAAASVIIEAAGGKIFKPDGSGFFPTDYLEGQRISDFLVAASPALYPQVRACLREFT